MYLSSLAFRSFRNLWDDHIEVHPRFNLIVGENGQGKSNLLEAIFCLGALRGFRTYSAVDLLRFDSEAATVVAAVEGNAQAGTVRVELGRGSRKIFVDGRASRRLSDYLGVIRVVLFVPEDVHLFKNSPKERRAFVDKAVFNVRPSYLQDLEAYNAVLKRRNMLLRDPRGEKEVLAAFDAQLVGHGSEVLSGRLRYLSVLQEEIKGTFAQIFGPELPVDVRYYPTWVDDVDLNRPYSSAEIEAYLSAALQAKRREEIKRGSSLVGPHRDDFDIHLDGRPARLHASQGQHRALVLALKIAEIIVLRDRFGVEPILLLDDISSELDAKRNQQLFAFLEGFLGQVFITSTNPSLLSGSDAVRVWHMREGHLDGQG